MVLSTVNSLANHASRLQWCGTPAYSVANVAGDVSARALVNPTETSRLTPETNILDSSEQRHVDGAYPVLWILQD